jgi:hypothetical protein
MKKRHWSRILLSEMTGSQSQKLQLFALVNLGLVQSLASGVITTTEAVKKFYHADNCLYVRKHLRNPEANAVMSRAVQLPDLLDALAKDEAQREFYQELEEIRAICLKLLVKKQPSSAYNRATA